MNYLCVKSSDSNPLNLHPIKNYINVLNVIVKPLGYVFEYDENVRKISLVNNQGEKQKTEKISLSLDSFSIKFKMDNNATIEIKCGDMLAPDNDTFGKAIITDTNGGESIIDFTYNVSPSLVLITHVQISMNNNKHVIYYNRDNDSLVFNKYNDKDECIGMDISRKDDSKSTIRFFSGDDEHICRISSSGDDSYHKLLSEMPLPEEQFDVQYEEYYEDGKKILIDFSKNDYYKHYRNAKLINNKNVRAILDEIVGSYKKTFPYEDDENGLLGGYLYKKYINGKPNDRLIVDRFLEAVNIPLITTELQRKEKKSQQRK